MNEGVYRELEARLGARRLRDRLEMEASMRLGPEPGDDAAVGPSGFVIRFSRPAERVIRGLLKATALYGLGSRNYRDIRVVENRVRVPKLDPGLEGLRILQLSDLHIDLDPRLVEVILERIIPLEDDLALLTGDYRNARKPDISDCLVAMRRIVQELDPPVFGILGNHDTIEMVSELEDMGLPVLLNEGRKVSTRKGFVYVAGIDDPHRFRNHDIEKAAANNNWRNFAVLLSHSPEVYAEAEPHVDLMLCGHTHGGQICLPGGYAVLRKCRCPRRMLKGPWRYKSLRGYTSPGTGATCVPVRFNCPPEITVHVLGTGND